MKPAPPVVSLDAAARVEALTRAYAGWPRDGEPLSGAGAALVHAFAHIADVVADRVNRAPDKNLLAFLELVGVRPAPPQTARVPLTFSLAAGATADVVVPARTRVAATVGPGESDPPVFETERDLVVTVTRLESVRTRDPGRDRHADRGLREGRYGAFDAVTWIDHRLYVASDLLLGLAETFGVKVRLSGIDPPEWPWLLRWERWSETGWMPLASAVERINADTVEVQLNAVTAVPRATIGGRTNRWLRARLETSIPRLGPGADAGSMIARSVLPPDAVVVNGEPAGPGPLTPFLTDRRLLLRSDEMLSKPGGLLVVDVRLGRSVPPTPSSDLRVRWQWLDAGTWRPLGEATPTGSTRNGSTPAFTDTTNALTRDGAIQFTLPPSAAPAQTEERWLLAEIVAGGYGAAPPVITNLELAYRWPRPRLNAPLVSARLQRVDRSLDTAFTNAVAVDLSKDFLPFGSRPLAGDTFSFACDDAFTPPRQNVTLAVTLTTPVATTGGATPPPASPQHELLLRWEYFDSASSRWTALGDSAAGMTTASPSALTDNTEAFTKDRQSIVVQLPATIGAIELNGITRRWLRVRIARGDYLNPPSVRTMTVSYSYVSPAAIAPDEVMAENDFLLAPLVRDDAGFLTPFAPSQDENPALYLGFDRPFSNQAMSLYFGVEDVAVPPGGLTGAVTSGPPVVVWEYWSGETSGWSRLETRDETRAFTRRGLVTFAGPSALAPSDQLGERAHWLRARWVAGGYLRPPVLERVATNTTWARHRTTIENEVVGSSTGRRDQVFRAARPPVLESERVEVRELETDGSPWTAWSEVVDFRGSTATDRHYTLDRAAGELRFGDGIQGRIPPRGRDNVRFALYYTGGGEPGNRAAGKVTRLLSTLPYVDAVTNPEPALGGIAAEGADALVERGPRLLRHRGRAVVASDFEDLAREASPSLARASAITGRTREASGSVGVVIVPAGEQARPMPTPELVERVDEYLRARSAATFDLWIAGPGWVRVDIEAELVPTGLELATDVENAVRARLREFLHPLRGGTGEGWPLGRRVFRSDVLAVLERADGVDHIRRLLVTETTVDPAPAPGAFLVYSGEHVIRVVGGD